MPDLTINGPLAYAKAGPLADKLVRLLLLHSAARRSVATASRLPGLSLAIETVRARLLAVDSTYQRRAA